MGRARPGRPATLLFVPGSIESKTIKLKKKLNLLHIARMNNKFVVFVAVNSLTTNARFRAFYYWYRS
jgi:hypothetical protein